MRATLDLADENHQRRREKASKRILGQLALLGLVAVVMLVVIGSNAWLRDTETSTGNVFTAATVGLNMDGGNTNAVKFNLTNFNPGNQRIGVWTLAYVGPIGAYLDLEDITVTSYENVCIEPERDAGDTTCGSPGQGRGELQNLIGLDLFVDYDCDGSFDSGEVGIHRWTDGPAGSISSSYDLNEPISAGGSVCIAAQFNWWSDRYGDDDLGQSDSMVLDITFELGQDPSQ